jgi:hypothetical protein
MRSTTVCSTLVVASICVVGGALAAGPDVIVGDMHQTKHHTTGGPVLKDGTPYRAYSIGTVSCNQGDVPLKWFQESTFHPVIPQNLYRVKDGRIQQIGMSWLKHGFCALQQEACGPCNPYGPNCETHLGIGCSDPYSADLNGSQGNLGPRYEVNASTGVFAFPFAFRNVTGDALYKRLQVKQSDLDPAQNPGAVYVAEAMYIHPDDATNGNGWNNASHRRVTVQANYSLQLEDTTNRTRPAIFAWRIHGNGPNQVDAGVTLKSLDVANDGRYWLAYKVTDLGNGKWHYEYAVENLTSDRSGGSLSLPVSQGVEVTNPYFHCPSYHSGEPYDDAPWNFAHAGGAVSWTTAESFNENPNANALRWNTLYNFAFDADQPPVAGPVTIGLFKPGTPTSIQFSAIVPATPPGCEGDVDGDGDVDQSDLGVMLDNYGQSVPPGTNGDVNGDGQVDQSDLGILLSNFGCV